MRFVELVYFRFKGTFPSGLDEKLSLTTMVRAVGLRSSGQWNRPKKVLESTEDPSRALQRLRILLQNCTTTNEILMGLRPPSAPRTGNHNDSNFALICGAPAEYLTLHEAIQRRKDKADQKKREAEERRREKADKAARKTRGFGVQDAQKRRRISGEVSPCRGEAPKEAAAKTRAVGERRWRAHAKKLAAKARRQAPARASVEGALRSGGLEDVGSENLRKNAADLHPTGFRPLKMLPDPPC